MSRKKIEDLEITMPPIYMIVALVFIGIVLFSVFAGVLFLSPNVPTNTVGIMVDSVTGEPDLSRTYPTGKYWFIGFKHFVVFPLTIQEVTFSLASEADAPTVTTRTRDGLLLSLDAYCQFRIIENEVLSVYQTYQTNYKRAIIESMRQAIRNQGSEFSAIETFENRTGLELSIELNLEEKVKDFGFELITFTLKSIDLPDSFEAAIEEKQVAEQAIKTAEYAYQKAEVEAKTLQLLAEADANITLIAARAAAEALIINAQAEAEGLEFHYTALSNASDYLKETLNLTNAELLSYLYIQAILQHDEAWLIIGTGTGFDFLIPLNSTGGDGAGDQQLALGKVMEMTEWDTGLQTGQAEIWCIDQTFNVEITDEDMYNTMRSNYIMGNFISAVIDENLVVSVHQAFT